MLSNKASRNTLAMGRVSSSLTSAPAPSPSEDFWLLSLECAVREEAPGEGTMLTMYHASCSGTSKPSPEFPGVPTKQDEHDRLAENG